MNTIVRSLAFLFIIMSLISCAKTKEQERESAIREARHFLTTMDCTEAIDALDSAGEDKNNADYVAVYASALACQAGYSDITVGLANLTNINASASGLFNSFASFDSSNETTADAVTYTKLMEGIYYILNSALLSGQPDTTTRLSKFGANVGNDLSMQTLLMLTVAIGKYFAFYGNTNTAGVKGAGTVTGGDICIGFYPFDARVDTDLGAVPLNGCNSANRGHGDLDPGVIAAATVKRRMCEGIILFNNLLDILSGIDLSSNSSLGNLGDTEAAINTLFTAAINAEAALSSSWGGTAISTLKDITSQSVCEEQTDADIQRYFVLLFETNL